MFSPDELKFLEENYRLTFQTGSLPLSVQISQLVDENQIHGYLTAIKENTKSANLGVAASLLVKRYSFSVLIALYSMSVLNKRIDFSIDNVSIQTLEEADTLWLPSIKFNCIDLSPAPEVNRDNWRNEIIKEVFANHIEVLFKQLNNTSKLSKTIMWENLYIYIVWMYKTLLGDHHYVTFHQTLKEDFEIITLKGNETLFGEYKENPLVKFRDSHDVLHILEGPTHNRQTCCLSYLTEDKRRFCKNCPIKRKKGKVKH